MKKILFIVVLALASYVWAEYYCTYCGKKYQSIASMTKENCLRHPNGALKGKHAPYEGQAKSEYYCKYCGKKYSSMTTLASENCLRHPDGALKGKHSPY